MIRRSMQRGYKKRRSWLSGTTRDRPALDVPGLDIDRAVFRGNLLISFSGLGDERFPV